MKGGRVVLKREALPVAKDVGVVWFLINFGWDGGCLAADV
jgi:hypothetical protein